TDQNLQRVIRTEFASSTVLTIAHRLDTVLDCDRILVFDQGRLAQCDEPKELINAGEGIFFELCFEGGYLDKMVNRASP
ncbi:multidrug resistance-associated protein 1, partial [Thraustotheca clavata]